MTLEFYICNLYGDFDFVVFEKFSSLEQRDRYYGALHPDYRRNCYKAYKSSIHEFPVLLTEDEYARILVDHLVGENKFNIISMY